MTQMVADGRKKVMSPIESEFICVICGRFFFPAGHSAAPRYARLGVIRRVLDHPARRVRGILAQKPLAMSYAEALATVDACEAAGVLLQVNQNMRYDQSVRALRSLIDRRSLGDPVVATIDMRAVPH